jgi:hypothetical protein
MLKLLLSISLTYLDQYQHAWQRFALNSATILGLLGLLFTTKPYRKTERFSAHVQISLLVVSYLVTLTGFTGTLSAPVTKPFRTSLSAVNATSTTAYVKSESTSPKMIRVTTVLSYLTLVVMCVVMGFLAFSFFDALKVGAALEKELGPSKLRTHITSKGRTAIYSLASILQNQARESGNDSKGTFLTPDKLSRQTKGSGISPPDPRVTRQLLRSKSVKDMHDQNGSISIRRVQESGESLRSASWKSARQQVVLMDETPEVFAPIQSRPSLISFKRRSGGTALGATGSPDGRVIVRKSSSATNKPNMPLPSLMTSASASSAPTINPFWIASAPRASLAPPSAPRHQ